MMIVVFETKYTKEVVNLWQRCDLTVPWNNPYTDIERKTAHSPDKFLIGLQKEKVIASVMYDYDGHRGSVSYLGVDPGFQGQGYGQKLMETVEERLKEMACPKLNLQVRSSNSKVLTFYKSLGYVQDDVISLGKRLEAPDRQTNLVDTK